MLLFSAATTSARLQVCSNMYCSCSDQKYTVTGITSGYLPYILSSDQTTVGRAQLWAFPKRMASGMNNFEAMAAAWRILMLFFLSHECSAQCKCLVYMMESV